jgi:two-component system, OmpR family, sensor kinase
MKRLFVSLYIAVAFGLLIINWSGEVLWQKLQSQNKIEYNQTLNVISNLVKPYAVSFHNDSAQKTINDIQRQLPYPVAMSDRDEFAFLPAHNLLLEQGQPIYLFNVDEHATFYIPVPGNKLLSIGPISLNYESQEVAFQQSVLTIVSYIMLALLILFWSWPLWRDLTTIRKHTQQVSAGHLDITNELKPRSVVFPLGEAMNKMANKIRSLLDFQKQMMQAVSHDIRTPLARLKFSIAIASNKADAETNKNYQEMLKDVAEVEMLVDEILTYGRLESSEVDINVTKVNIYELAMSVATKLNRNHRKSITVECDSQLQWNVDAHLIERALQNLLTNGQRYAKSFVKLSVSSKNGVMEIRVSDDGKGISPENRESIFEPFSRLEKSRNKKSGGFGLGLAIVKRIINWHQGIIKVERNEVGGAEFVVSLPQLKNLIAK